MLSTGSHESKRQIANMRPGAQSGAELGAQAAPGKRRIQGAVRSEAAQLPLSRATGPTAQGAAWPARRNVKRGVAVFLVVRLAVGHRLTLLADVSRSVQAVLHTRRLHPSLAAIWGGKSRASCTDCTKRTDCTHNAS